MDELSTTLSQWRGKKIRLRALEPADWETYFHWNLDDEQARALYWVPLPQSAEAARRFAERESVRTPEGDDFRFAIARVTDDIMVGDLTVKGADARTGAFSYGISIAYSERRQGYASEAVRLALRYYFEERRYQKATVRIYSFNEASIRLHESLGFQREGCIRRTVYTRGQYYDEVIYGMTAEEFRAQHLYGHSAPDGRPQM